MPHFVVEIHMADAGQLVLEQASRMLEAAQVRLGRAGHVTRTILAGLCGGDQRLLYVVEAGSPDAARRLFVLALLPAAEIREITLLVGGRLLARGDPGGDVGPGSNAELVEDVVDVGLDGALGQE